MIMYLIFINIFRGPPIEMAIHPLCQTSKDAGEKSDHYKYASEDFILKLIQRSEFNQIQLMTFCSPELIFLTSAATLSATRPMRRGRRQTCPNTCPARCGWGSQPWPKIRFIALGDANSLMLGRVETDVSHSVNPSTDDLLLLSGLDVRIVHCLSHRLSSPGDIVFIDWCLMLWLRTGSQLLRCMTGLIGWCAAWCYLLVTGRSVIPSRWSRPDESEPSHNYRDIHIEIYHDFMPGRYDVLIKTDDMTDHWQRPIPKSDLLYTGKTIHCYV